jgi:hypothetical protein
MPNVNIFVNAFLEDKFSTIKRADESYGRAIKRYLEEHFRGQERIRDDEVETLKLQLLELNQRIKAL